MKDYFPMQYYCTRCKEPVEIGHECTGHAVWITDNVKTLVDMMSDLGFRVMKATGYSSPLPAPGKTMEYTLYIGIAYHVQYPILSIISMPPGWTYYTRTSSADHTPVSVLMYTEQGKWRSGKAIVERIKAIVDEFLETVDKDGLSSVLALSQGW